MQNPGTNQNLEGKGKDTRQGHQLFSASLLQHISCCKIYHGHVRQNCQNNARSASPGVVSNDDTPLRRLRDGANQWLNICGNEPWQNELWHPREEAEEKTTRRRECCPQRVLGWCRTHRSQNRCCWKGLGICWTIVIHWECQQGEGLLLSCL